MSSMLSDEEQVSKLLGVQMIVAQAKCSSKIEQLSGDVPHLRAIGVKHAAQIVCATGTFDVWSAGKLIGVDISENEAADIIIMECRSGEAIASGVPQ